MMLVEGKVDALGMSGASGDQYAKNYDAIVMSEYRYDYVSEGTRVGLMKNSPELLAKINEIIAEVEAEGLYQKWIGEAQELSDSLAVS
jgi:ABC-type amino acid transport substrate-binding protein